MGPCMLRIGSGAGCQHCVHLVRDNRRLTTRSSPAGSSSHCSRYLRNFEVSSSLHLVLQNLPGVAVSGTGAVSRSKG